MSIQGPEACDDPKMSGTIAVSYSSLILCALCHTVWGHNSFTIFLCPSSLKFLSVSVYLQTDTAKKIIAMLQRKTAHFITCRTKEIRIVICFCILFDVSETCLTISRDKVDVMLSL